MNPVTAIAVRRAATTGAALAATLVAHMLSGGMSGVVIVAPLIWASVVLLALPLSLVRRPTGPFRARRPAEVLVSLLLIQAATHVAMSTAPWAFGIVGHQHGLALGASALVAHAAAAVLLSALICFGERLLAAAVHVVRALLAPDRRSRLPRVGRVLSRCAGAPARIAHRPRTSRGPPVGRLVPAAVPCH